jgi:archaemetzincin
MALLATVSCVRETFIATARIEEPLAEPLYAWNGAREQYNSFEVMRALARLSCHGADRVLGITEYDLFIPALTFVFGQAQLDGRVAIVSFARLRQRMYGLPEDEELLRLRLRKEVIHEVGHTLGLIHCRELTCAMHLSTSIMQVDMKEDRFCEVCLRTVRRRVNSLEAEKQ